MEPNFKINGEGNWKVAGLCQHRLLFAALLLSLFSLLSSCGVVGPDDLKDLDFRGNWQIIAQHQKEPELTVRYMFELTENVDHSFSAAAQQYLLEMPLGNKSIQVGGQIFFDGLQLRIEFDYPNSDRGLEVFTANVHRVSTQSSIAAVTDGHYLGVSVGLIRPNGTILGYDTDIVSMDQVRGN